MHDHPAFINALEEVNQIVDGLGMPVDDGIKNAVAAFRASGFTTTASCEGHVDRGLPYPWIDFGIQTPPAETSIDLPPEVSSFNELFGKYIDKNSDVDILAMISSKQGVKPNYQFTLFEKDGEIEVRNTEGQKYTTKESAILKEQFERMSEQLSKYYELNNVEYEDLLIMDPMGVAGGFRLQPVKHIAPTFMPKSDRQKSILQQLKNVNAFAEAVFNDFQGQK